MHSHTQQTPQPAPQGPANIPPRRIHSLFGIQFPTSPDGAAHWAVPIGTTLNMGRTAKY